MIQIGAVYIWTYVYNIIRASSSKKNEENTEGNDSIGRGEISESWTEPLVSKGSRRFEDYEAQAESPPTGSEDKVRVSSLFPTAMSDYEICWKGKKGKEL